MGSKVAKRNGMHSVRIFLVFSLETLPSTITILGGMIPSMFKEWNMEDCQINDLYVEMQVILLKYGLD